MAVFDVKVAFDTVCPWCYVGKKQLERGIAQYQKQHPNASDSFVTTWLPFQLNPSAPSPGIDKRGYLASRFGAQKVPMMESHLGNVGKSVGINFKFGGTTGNTYDSHRLILLAKEKAGVDAHNKVVEELQKAYFENEQDITSHQVLTDAAVRAGLNEGEVKGWLSSDAGAAEVDQELRATRARGVTGVPNYVMQDKYEIGGAQDGDAFAGIFEKIKQMEKQ